MSTSTPTSTPTPVAPPPVPSSGPVNIATPPPLASNQELSVLPDGEAIHAGFWRRAAAYWIDTLILLIPLGLLRIVPILGILLAIVARWLYYALMESSERQATLGKLAMGLKVTDERGHRIKFGRATGRFFGGAISSIIFCIGYMMAGWTERRQALHDMMAGTFVVFDDVRPGHLLPEKRRPMPWYGWTANIAVPLAGIIIYAAIAAFAYHAIKNH